MPQTQVPTSGVLIQQYCLADWLRSGMSLTSQFTVNPFRDTKVGVVGNHNYDYILDGSLVKHCELKLGHQHPPP